MEYSCEASMAEPVFMALVGICPIVAIVVVSWVAANPEISNCLLFDAFGLDAMPLMDVRSQ